VISFPGCVPVNDLVRPMFKRFLPICALLGLLATSLGAQERVRARLFTRVDDGKIRAAIDVDIDPGWHLYHEELGDSGAIGKPTTVKLSGEGIEWGKVQFPEPHRLRQENFLDPAKPLFVLSHEGRFVLRAEGTLAPGAKGDDVTAKLDGLVCDAAGCIPYSETLKSSGKGSDALFADATAAGEDAHGDEEHAAEPDTTESAGPAAPTEDERVSGRADATLYTRVEAGEVLAALRIAIEPGWHLYHTELGHPKAIGKPLRIRLHGEGVTWEDPVVPEPHQIDQSELGKGIYILGHEGTIVVYARGHLEEGGDAKGVWAEVTGQTCTELCVEYAETVVPQGEGPQAVWAGWADAMAEVGSGDGADEGSEKEEQGLAGFLLLAVFWGLFTLLMPCTYPMIPITISFFTKQAESRGGKVLPLSLAYGTGIVAIFILIGVVFGSVIIPFATHPVTNIVIGAAFLYFAFVLFGVVHMNPPRFLMDAAGKASTTGGFLGVFLMGATLVVTSFTCTAPFVGSLLSVGAADGDLGRVVMGMGVFGLTMAIPFVLLSLVPGKIAAMPRSGQWMNTLKFTLGFVELAASFKFFSNSDIVWGWNVLSREVFLALWGVIFLLAGLYLFGVVRFKGAAEKKGAVRLSGGAIFLAFSGYSFYGLAGNELDAVMTAIIPNYSHTGYEVGGQWELVKDDYDAALEVARDDGKLLFLNFTGHT